MVGKGKFTLSGFVVAIDFRNPVTLSFLISLRILYFRHEKQKKKREREKHYSFLFIAKIWTAESCVRSKWRDQHTTKNSINKKVLDILEPS